MLSSMVAHNSKGYDSTRSERFLAESPMVASTKSIKSIPGRQQML